MSKFLEGPHKAAAMTRLGDAVSVAMTGIFYGSYGLIFGAFAAGIYPLV